MADDKKANDKGPEERLAYFGCKNCGAVNQQPFPEVRVVVQKEPCKCGLDSSSRQSRHWATGGAIAASVLILAAFGSCVADHHFTTEQIKALPAHYKVERKQSGSSGLGPAYTVQELSPEEKERRAMTERIRALEKELEEKTRK